MEDGSKHLFGAPMLAVAAILTIAVGIFYLRGVVVSDDAFITFRVAENMVNEGNPVYNPNDRHFVSTSPLWTCIVAGARSALPDTPIQTLTKTICGALLLSATLLLMHLFRNLGVLTLLIPLPIMANHEALDSGNEVALCFFLLTATLWVYRRSDNLVLTGLTLGLFYLGRGEGALLGIPIAIDYFTRHRLRAIPQLFLFGLAFFAVSALWHVYLYSELGQWLPNTLRTKILQGQSPHWPSYASHLPYNAIKSVRFVPALLFFAAFGALYLTTKEWLLTAWACIHTLAYVLLGVPNYDWYYYPMNYFLSLSVFFFVPFMLRFVSYRYRTGIGIALTALLAFVYLNAYTPDGRRELASKRSSQGGRLSTYREVGLWLKENAEGGLVAADEIGVMGYYSGDTPFVDPPGILIPDIPVEHIGTSGVDQMRYVVERFRPAYLIFRVEDPPQRLVYNLNGKSIQYEKVIEIDKGMKCAIFRLS